MPATVPPEHEIPGVEAERFDDPRLAVGVGIGIPGVADRIGRALLVGQPRRTRSGHDQHLVLGFGDAGNRERNARIDDIGDEVDAAGVVPLACDSGGDVGLVLVIGRYQFNLERRLGLRDEIIDRHLRRGNGAGAGEIRKHPGHIRQHADLHRAVGNRWRLRDRSSACRRERRGHQGRTRNGCSHRSLPCPRGLSNAAFVLVGR